LDEGYQSRLACPVNYKCGGWFSAAMLRLPAERTNDIFGLRR
jgi:hypothetical protein